MACQNNFIKEMSTMGILNLVSPSHFRYYGRVKCLPNSMNGSQEWKTAHTVLKPYSFLFKTQKEHKGHCELFDTTKSLYPEGILEGIINENKPSHNTAVKRERSFASLVESKRSSRTWSKDLTWKRAKCCLSGILRNNLEVLNTWFDTSS